MSQDTARATAAAERGAAASGQRLQTGSLLHQVCGRARRYWVVGNRRWTPSLHIIAKAIITTAVLLMCLL